MKVLFVDDELAILEQAKVFLEREEDKLEIHTARSVQKGLQLMEKEEYEAIVSDYQMPEVDGLEFLKLIREDRESDIPFLVFTGKGREEVAVKALNLGANRYIQKGGDPKSQYGVLARAIVQEVKHRRLESRRDFFKISATHAPESIFVSDRSGKIIYVNDRASEKLGFSVEELEDMSIFDLDPNFSPGNWNEYWERVREEKRCKLETENVKKDGTRFPVELLINHVEHEGREYHFTFVRDITKRKERERELQASERSLKNLIDSMNDTAWVIDFEGNFLEVNETALESLGYSREELLSMGPMDIDAGLESDFIQELIERMEEDRTQIFETTHRTKEGKEIPVEISSSLIEYRGESAILSVARDISDRKEVKEELRFRNTLLESLLENIPDTVYFKDGKANFIEVSNSKAEELGVDKEEVVGKSDLDFFPEEQARKMYADDMRVIQDEESIVDKEEKYVTPNGEEKWVSTTKVPLYDSEGSVMGMMGISRDITKRKERRREVERERNLLDSMLKNFPASIYIKNKEGEHIRISKMLEKRLKERGVEEVIGKTDEELYPEQVSDYEEDLEVMEKEEPVINREDESEHPERGKVYNLISKAPIYNEDGEVRGLVGLNLDVTDRKEVEKRMRFLHSVLRHDVRNKAQITEGYLELLKETELSEEQKEMVNKALNSAREGVDMIEKIRVLRELDEIEREEVDIAPLVQEAVDENRALAGDRGIEIEFEGCECVVEGGQLLKRIFSNLVENSIVHANCDLIMVNIESDDKECIIRVEDDGIGVPDSEKDRIFDKGMKSEVSGGSGLGLYLVREIAKSYGGRVDLEDSNLGGAKFVVRLNRS
ncbi:MAG: PAS domain S-box protein [Candidatus Hadarchaeota archaeon]